MGRFVEGADRGQSTLLPECLDDWVDDENPVRVIDAIVETLDLGELGFCGIQPAPPGRPGDHPATLLKLYVYSYLNRVQSSRRLEREAGSNLELLWLLGRLVPDHKTIADFRMAKLDAHEKRMLAAPDGQVSLSASSRSLNPNAADLLVESGEI